MSCKMMIVYELTITRGISNCDTLKEIRDRVEMLINAYGEQAQYKINYDYGYIQEVVTWCEEESDEEYRSRIKREKVEEEKARQRRYEQYVALKKEFEGE